MTGAGILVLDAAVRGGLAAIVRDGAVLAERRLDAPHGVAAALPGFVAALVADGMPGMVAVTVGPGSFTGIRAALSLAHGLALAGAIPLVGVTVPEALAVDPDADRPGALGIAAAALLRQAGELPPLPAQPLYAQAPKAYAAVQRPAPA